MKKIISITVILLIVILGIFLASNLIPMTSKTIQLDEKLGKNIYISKINDKDIYKKSKSKVVTKEIKKLYTWKNTLDNPLIIYNAYKTNELALNIYFYTSKNTTISYEISAENTNKFKKTAYEENTKNHAIQIIGLTPGKTNKIKIISKDKNSNTKTYSFTIKVPNLSVPKVLATSYSNQGELVDGLYVLFGTLNGESIDDVYLVDNNGDIRGKLPLQHNKLTDENNTTDNIQIYDNYLYYNVSYNKIAKINRLGEVKDIITWDDYSKHHDFKIDEKNQKILILATKNNISTIEDMIMIYDMKKNKISSIIDLKNLLPEIYKKSKKVSTFYSKDKVDWIHVNSIDIKNEEIIISSRELSSIICIDNIYTKPKLKYILGPKEIYANTSYESLVFEKKGDFDIQLGQHTAYFYTKNNKNYISLYNNNLANSETVDWVYWDKLTSEKKLSYYYLYELDEDKKSFSLAEKMTVPFSGYMSSVQILDENKIISSREAMYFAEYNKDGKVLKDFIIDQYNYRVNKYTFKNIWFK